MRTQKYFEIIPRRVENDNIIKIRCTFQVGMLIFCFENIVTK